MTAPQRHRIEARHYGQCPRCEGPIRPGHLIEPFNDPDRGTWTWAHADCPADPTAGQLELQPGEQVCPSCWTVHRGDCA